MAGPLATAFVELRPQFGSFNTDLQRGVEEAVSKSSSTITKSMSGLTSKFSEAGSKMSSSLGRASTETANKIGSEFSRAGSKMGEEVKRGSDSGEGSLRGLAAKAAGIFGGIFAIDKGTEFAKSAVDAGREAIKTDKLIENAITATGGAANVTAAQIDALTGSISTKTGIDKAQIASADQLLLRFGQVQNVAGEGNNIFDRTTKVAVDLSAALGKDLTGTVSSLGRALSDPARGMLLLRREGIVLTADQQEQVKAMLAGVVTAKSSAAALKAHEAATKGAATASDALNKAQQHLADVHAQLAGKTKLTTAEQIQLRNAEQGVDAASGKATAANQKLTDSQKAGAAGAGGLLGAQKLLLGFLTDKYGGAAEAIATPGQKLHASLQIVKEDIGKAVIPTLDRLASFFAHYLPGAIEVTRSVFGSISSFIKKAVDEILGGWENAGAKISAGGLAGAFLHVGALVRTIFDDIKGVIYGFTGSGAMDGLGKSTVPFVAGGEKIRAVWEALQPVLERVEGFVKGHLTVTLIALGVGLGLVFAPITTIIAGLVLLYVRFSAVRDGVSAAGAVLKAVFDDVSKAVGSLVAGFDGKGKSGVSFFTDLGHAAAGLATIFTQRVLPIIKRFGEFLLANKPILIGIGVALALVTAPGLALAAGFVYLYQKSALFRDIVSEVAGLLKDVLVGAFNQISLVVQTVTRLFADLIHFVTDVFQGKWKAAFSALADIPKALLGYLVGTVANIIGLFTGLPPKLLGHLGDLASGIGGFFASLPGLAADALVSLGSSILSAFARGFVALVSALPGLAVDLIGFFIHLPFAVLQALINLPGDLINFLAEVFVRIAPTVGNGILAVLKFFEDLPGRTVSALAELGPQLLGAITGAFTTVIAGIPGLVGQIVDAVGKIPGELLRLDTDLINAGAHILSSIVDGLASAGSGALSVAGNIVNAIIDGINGAVIDPLKHQGISLPFVGKIEPFADLPDIPHLDIGGVIGADGLIFAHKGEAVVNPATSPARQSQVLAAAGVAAPSSTVNHFHIANDRPQATAVEIIRQQNAREWLRRGR